MLFHDFKDAQPCFVTESTVSNAFRLDAIGTSKTFSALPSFVKSPNPVVFELSNLDIQ